MSSDTTKHFSDKLDDLISNSGLGSKALAHGIGISDGALSNYKNDCATASIDALVKIAKYFHVSTDWLLGLSEYRSKKNEQALAKDIGLSEKAINALSILNSGSYMCGILRVINTLIEQETPVPSIDDFEAVDGDYDNIETLNKHLEEFLEKTYGNVFAEWEKCDYSPVISRIATFLLLRIDPQKKYWLNTDGSITPRPFDAPWFKDLGAVNTFQSKDIIDQMLFAQIEDELKKLRDKLQADPEWGTDTPLVIHHGQVKED